MSIKILQKNVILTFFATFIFPLFFLFVVCDEVWSQTVLKGKVIEVAQKGNVIEVSFNTPINFYFTEIGDMVSAYTKEDILVGDDFYIPSGSRIEGIITRIKSPKSFGRGGGFEIDFSQIITPRNLTIPVHASVSTDTSGATKKIADILTYDSALVAYGSFHGVIAGLQYGGLPLAISTHGISLLAGAGIGASAGIIGSAVRKGNIPTVLTRLDSNVVLKSDFYIFGDLPNLKDKELKEKEEYKGFRFFPALKKEDIELKIVSVKKEHSKEYGDYFLISFNLKNNSNQEVSLSDLILLSKPNSEPLHPDLFLSGQEVLNTIKPLSEGSAKLAFVILIGQGKIDDYVLALVDPLDGDEIVRVPLRE